MRRTTPIALALTAAALLLTGCGSESGGGDANGQVPGSTAGTTASGATSQSPSAPHSPSAPSSPSPGSSGGGCGALVQLTSADNGRTVCVAKGGELRLTLDGTKGRPWKPVAASGSALRAINAGFVLQPGDATAAYQAVAPGTARLTSSQPLCAEPTAPGQMSCKGIKQWTVTVRVA